MAAADGILLDESEAGMCDLEGPSLLFRRECSLGKIRG